MLWKTLNCQSCISLGFVREGNKTAWQLITAVAVGLRGPPWQVLLADSLPLQSPDRNVRLNKTLQMVRVRRGWCGSMMARGFGSSGPSCLPRLWGGREPCQKAQLQPVLIFWYQPFCRVNEFCICFDMKLFPEIPGKELFEMISCPRVLLKPVNFDCYCNSFVREKNKKGSFYLCVNLAWEDVLEKRVGCTPFSQSLCYRFQLCGD